MDKHLLAKKGFVNSFFVDFHKRWGNIQSLHEQFPGEGLVLVYCFVEALGYYRYGVTESKLSSTEQFYKVLSEYQQNRHFFAIPPLLIRDLPLAKNRRQLGRNIKLEVLAWLKSNYSNSTGIDIETVWKSLPQELASKLSQSETRVIGHLYQITWAGLYYDHIRTAGVHQAYFNRFDSSRDWEIIQKAATEILENLTNECLEKIKFPHQLPQPKSL